MRVYQVLSVGLLLAVAAQLDAAIVPYSNDFSGTGSNTAFPQQSPANWALSGGTYNLSLPTGLQGPAVATIPIDNAPTTGSFTVETQFNVSAVNSIKGLCTLGFGLFGDTSGFASGADYLATFGFANNTTPLGALSISAQNHSGVTSTPVNVTVSGHPGNIAVPLNTTYTLRLVGTYTGGTLNMTLGLFDAAGTTQIGSSATASDSSPLTGTYFGYRNRPYTQGSTVIAFDNFAITPEPATLSLVGLGLLGLLRRKR